MYGKIKIYFFFVDKKIDIKIDRKVVQRYKEKKKRKKRDRDRNRDIKDVWENSKQRGRK